MEGSKSTVAPVWSDLGPLRSWLHTRAGAKLINAQTAWFRIRAPKGYAVLTTIGRRTGLPRRSNIRAVGDDRRMFIVSIAGRANDWYHNAVTNPQVRLRLGRHDRVGQARLPTDDERANVRTAYSDGAIHWFDFVSSVVNQPGLPTPRRIRKLHAKWLDEGQLLVIDLHQG
jgi:deazaflavin-dependent oxidoreductase (nitroreductase family)